MCGIFGIFSESGSKFSIENSLNKLKHRGPDDSGVMYWYPGTGYQQNLDLNNSYRVALGHQRLSIIDLTEAGKQPMLSHDREKWIVYNGEVYNYIELRQELEQEGIRFKTKTDTEVVLEALIYWGPENAVKRFRGMFAIAYFDMLTDSITLIRDPFGIKPLYYCRWLDGLAFSSEISPLLDLEGVDKSLDPENTWHYLRFGVANHGANSMISGVKQVKPGCLMRIFLNQSGIELLSGEYWSAQEITPKQISYEEAVQKVRKYFLDNVRLHLRSDVPVGVALSGGVDSSAIVCAVRYLNPDQEIHTFSYIADDERISEEKWVDMVNLYTQSIPHKVKPLAGNLISDIQGLMHVQGEPFGSTSIYAQNQIFRAAHAAGIKVMLDGQGADEMLGGYTSYQGARLASLISAFSFGEALKFLGSQKQWPDRNIKSVLVNGLGHLLPDLFRPIARTLVGRTDSPIWCNLKWFDQMGVKRQCHWYHDKGGEYLRADLMESLEVGLIGLLRYEDRNSMAYSIESRVPFLTVDFCELLLSLPESYLISEDGTTKKVFKDAMRGIVPDVILDRRDKVGFATPEFDWLKKNPQLLSNALAKADKVPCFNYDGLNKYCEEVMSGKIPFSFQLWRLINFIEWFFENRLECEKA
jgi:asparagine synthase (glutamine-hydrolysing)